MSVYVPPHLQRDEVIDTSDVSSPAFQQAAWKALARSLTSTVNKVSAASVQQTATELFRENLVRGRGLLARSLMRTQQADPEITHIMSSLVAVLNKELPTVVELLCKRLVTQWNLARRRKDWRSLENTSKFLCGLYVFEVVDVSVVYQMILAHLTSETRSDEDVDQAARIFRDTFRAMSIRSRREYHEQVLDPFRDMLAMDDDELRLSTRSQAVLEACLQEVQQWEKVKAEQGYIQPELVFFELAEQTHHVMDISDKYDQEEKLDRYQFDPEYAAHEESYEAVRQAILGENWEMELLQQVAEATDDDDEEDGDEEGGDNDRTEDRKPAAGATPSGSAAAPVTAASASAEQALVDAEERKVRQEVYMAIRNSVRADEAVHKILKAMKPNTERTICFMVVEGCCEERSYKKVYSMIAERLCKGSTKFQSFFAESCRERYLDATNLTSKQIEYSARIYAHLLRTDSLFWGRCLNVMDIVHNDESQRLFIQFLLQSLTEEMGTPAVKERFQKDRELVSQTTKLFPVHRGAEDLERAINLYVAMNVGELAEPLRAVFDRERQQARGLPAPTDRKRPRDDGY